MIERILSIQPYSLVTVRRMGGASVGILLYYLVLKYRKLKKIVFALKLDVPSVFFFLVSFKIDDNTNTRLKYSHPSCTVVHLRLNLFVIHERVNSESRNEHQLIF